MKFIITRGLALFFLLMVSQSVQAKGWVGTYTPCAPGGYQITNICDWYPGKNAYYGKGQPVRFMTSGGNVGDGHAYVPSSGNYTLKLYWCPYPENMDTCSKGKGSVLLSAPSVYLSSGQSFAQQQVIKSDVSATSNSAGAYCITLSDDQTGYEYRGDMGYGPDGRGKFCGDAHRLPVNPPICSFNSDANLDIQLGALERGDIAVKAGTSSPVTKDITVNCGGNIVYNANMKLDYTPISVSNDNVVSTSTKGLGVAVLYKGKAIQPGDSFPLSYQPGINTLTLGFEAVRDPAMALSDLKTGDFTANAVLVFTEQ